MGLGQQGIFKNFPVIPVRLEPCDLPLGLFAHSAVDAFDGHLEGSEAARLLRSIHGLADLTAPRSVKEQVLQNLSSLAGDPVDPLTSAQMPVLYVTCGWRDSGNERLLRRLTCDVFASENFYLIGDAEDHQHTVEARIRSIMAGCSAHLIILPKRADSFSDPSYKSLRSEIGVGKELGLPQLVVAERGVSFPKGDVTAFLELEVGNGSPGSEIESEVTGWAQDLREECAPPRNPQFVFVATDYDDLVVKEHVTGTSPRSRVFLA